jgi:nucleoside-diphosphate-sugar epimerase
LRILVIGGTGFIGRFVIPLLHQAGHAVAVFHRGTGGASLPADVRQIHGDRHRLGDHATEFRERAPDVVIDMIASSAGHARDLVQTFRDLARRVVVVSSMDVYRAAAVLHRLDDGPLEPVPLTEESPLRTSSQTYPAAQIQALKGLFGWLDDGYDKVAVERAVQGDLALPATILRLPMVYGPGDRLHRFHPVLKRIADGRLLIPFEERTAGWRSPRGYVENVAAAIALAATDDRASARVYNVGEPDALSELEWARLIAEASGWRGRLVTVPSERAPAHLVSPANLDQHWVADTSRIRSELGYREPVPRPEAIRRSVEWERAHPPAGWDPAQFDYAVEDALDM